MMNIHLLVIGRDERFLSTAQTMMEKEKIHTMTASSEAEALRMIDQKPVDVVILNLEMADRGGKGFLSKIKRQHPLVEVIMMTDHASVASAIEGLKSGAFDYIIKPCDVSRVVEKIREAKRKKMFMEEKINKSKVDRIISHPMAVFDNDAEDKE